MVEGFTGSCYFLSLGKSGILGRFSTLVFGCLGVVAVLWAPFAVRSSLAVLEVPPVLVLNPFRET